MEGIERSHVPEPELTPPPPQSQSSPKEEDHGKLIDWLLLNKEDSDVMDDYTRDELNFTDLLAFDQQTSQQDVNDDSGRYSFTHEDYFNSGGGPDSMRQATAGDGFDGEIPDFNDTSNRSMTPLDEPPAAEGNRDALSKNLKLKFREYSRPVPASYYRSYSYNCSNNSYARNDPVDQSCFDQQDCLQSSPAQSSMISTQDDFDQRMRGPPPPARSLSCPESKGYRGDPLLFDDTHVMPFHSMRGAHHHHPQHQQHQQQGMMYRESQYKGHQHHHQNQMMDPSMVPPYELYHSSSFDNGRLQQQQPIRVYDEGIEVNNGPYQNIAHTIKMKSQQHLGGIIHTGTVISQGRMKQTLKGKKAAPLQKAKLNVQNKRGSSKISSSSSSSSSPTSEKKTASKRSSKYRGVTKHRRSGRWEAHIWVRETGKQVYLGGYELEEHAAEAYDVAALKCKGTKVKTNFEVSKYTELLQYMDTISLEELVMAVRRQSQGFARGSSKYRGVTRHPNGRWEARIGMPGSRHIYLGLFNDEPDAAKSYDRALVKLRGSQAATNFALSNYTEQLKEYHTSQQEKILTKSSQHPASSAKVKNESNGETFLDMKAFQMQPGSHPSPATAAIADHATRCI